MPPPETAPNGSVIYSRPQSCALAYQCIAGGHGCFGGGSSTANLFDVQCELWGAGPGGATTITCLQERNARPTLTWMTTVDVNNRRVTQTPAWIMYYPGGVPDARNPALRVVLQSAGPLPSNLEYQGMEKLCKFKSNQR